jgi:glycosyltransferase involved in cell wall biosynthesis
MKDDRSAPSQRDLEARVAELERQVEWLYYEVINRRRQGWRTRLMPNLFKFQQYWPRPLKIPDGYATVSPPTPAPSIAIVTPSLNHGQFIERTINSVLSQNYPNLQYTIQDGDSDDSTTAVLARYADRVDIVSEADTGQADAINRGFKRVNGDIMGWLNSDDVLLPGTLAYVARFMSEHPDVDLVYGHRIFIDSVDREIGRAVLPRHDSSALRWFDYIPQETLFWRRRVWDRLQPLDTSFVYALDWDFILRAVTENFRFRRLPRFLGGFRVHPAQKTTGIMDVGRREMDRLRLRSLGSVKPPPLVRLAVYRYFLAQHIVSRCFRHGIVKF